jgi:hypothetical protein
MQFEGSELQEILARQSDPIRVYDSRSFLERTISAAGAVELIRGEKYFGVGHRGRIRYIRRADGSCDLRAASRTVVRPRKEAVYMGPDTLLEHKGEQATGRIDPNHSFRNRVIMENTLSGKKLDKPRFRSTGTFESRPKRPMVESRL